MNQLEKIKLRLRLEHAKEIQRLRAALEEIAKHGDSAIDAETARKALAKEGK